MPDDRRDGRGVSSRAGPARAWECGSRPAPTGGLGGVDECPADAKCQMAEHGDDRLAPRRGVGAPGDAPPLLN
eukprot:scaffold113035_cov35-Tisochrysis_lutea.AAC.3